MSKDNILLLDKSDGIATITLNRPDKLNAFNDELSYALQETLTDLEKDNSIRVLIITGAGRGFCS
jgi:2-(1,2-epoxy-1,2-dihydrophenyl)acetyl-CoA isomerase